MSHRFYDDVVEAALVIVPADYTVFNPPLRRLYVGGTGNVTVKLQGSSTAVTFVGVPAGTILRVNATHVMATNTTATSLVGFSSPALDQSVLTTLLAPLVTDGETFYAPTASYTYGLTPAVLTNSQTFYGPTSSATYPLTPALMTNTQTFHAATVAQV